MDHYNSDYTLMLIKSNCLIFLQPTEHLTLNHSSETCGLIMNFYSFCGRLSPVTLCCVTLAVWLCCGAHTEASVLNLKRFIGCAVREFTFLARKPGCSGLHITTDACWGRCETWEVRLMLPAHEKHTHIKREKSFCSTPAM